MKSQDEWVTVLSDEEIIGLPESTLAQLKNIFKKKFSESGETGYAPTHL